MATNTTLQSPESSRPEAVTNQKERLVLHLFCVPVALLFLIGAFTYRWVLIPTAGQIAFGLAAMAITIIVMKRIGRKLLYAFKQQPDDDTSQLTKRLLSYYGVLLIIAVMTITIGSYLNTHYPDLDKQEKQTHETEKLSHIK
ncbi:MAG: SoxR reducing system RseC family protein [Bacteroides sp.]|nr:SoxR reducing system RseC family protein [Bacteroides sp.]